MCHEPAGNSRRLKKKRRSWPSNLPITFSSWSYSNNILNVFIEYALTLIKYCQQVVRTVWQKPTLLPLMDHSIIVTTVLVCTLIWCVGRCMVPWPTQWHLSWCVTSTQTHAQSWGNVLGSLPCLYDEKCFTLLLWVEQLKTKEIAQ